jgi:hypothetical protein
MLLPLRSGRTALLLTLLLAICAGVFVLCGPPRALDLLLGEQRSERVVPALVEPPRAAAESAPEMNRQAVAPLVAMPDASADRVHVNGLLADARSGLPLPGHTVILAWHPTDDPPLKATTVTGPNGEFALELAGEHWKTGRYYGAQVLDPLGHDLFRGLILLQSELSLEVEPRQVLAGRLETKPAIDYPGVLLRVWTPPAQALATQLLCGEVRLSADGSFSLPIDEPVPSDELLLVFSDRSGGFADAPIPRMMIDAGLAPTIVRELVDLEITVRTSDGQPAQGTQVRVFPRGESGEIRWNILTADAAGSARLHLQLGAYELCAGKEGFLPVVEEYELTAQPQTRGIDLVLEPLRESDVVTGEVLAQDGTPVAGALVTARPATVHAELAQPGAVHTVTDASGLFRLAAAADRPLVFSAEHADHGSVVLEPTIAGDAPVRIVFEPLGSIEVRPASALAESPISSGPMQYFLVERGGERIESGYSNGCPWRIDGVVAGEYDVFLMAHGQASYAEGNVSVPMRAAVSLDAELAPSSFFVGRLVDAAGNPLPGREVQLVHPYWPMRLVRAWATVTSGMDGSFRLFTGNQREGSVRILRNGEEITRVELCSTSQATITLSGS